MPRPWQGKNRHRLKRELPFQSRQTRIQSVSVDIQVAPATASLVLTAFAPTVATPRVVTPGKASLILTTFAPVVSTPRVVTPATRALVLTRFAPTVSTSILATPGTRAMTLSTFAPTVSAPASVALIPGTASLFLTRYAPSLPDLIAGSPGGGSSGNLAQFPDSGHFAGPPLHLPEPEAQDQPLDVPDITPALPVAAKVDNAAAIIALFHSNAIDEDTMVVLLAAA